MTATPPPAAPVCPHCGAPLDPSQVAALLGSIRTERKAKSSAANGKRGGRPMGSRNKRKKENLK